MDTTERKKRSRLLKFGDIQRLADLAEVHRDTVNRWIRGEIKESSVEPYFIAFTEKRQKQLEIKLSKVA